jgi:hypothetical protein
MKAFIGLVILLCLAVTASAQRVESDSRIKELEQKLVEATRHLEQATGIIQWFGRDISFHNLRGGRRTI